MLGTHKVATPVRVKDVASKRIGCPPAVATLPPRSPHLRRSPSARPMRYNPETLRANLDVVAQLLHPLAPCEAESSNRATGSARC